MISTEKLEREIHSANTRAYKRAKKNGIATHVIKISDEIKFSIKFRVDVDNTDVLMREYKLNEKKLDPRNGLANVRSLVNLHEQLERAEQDAAEQAKRKGAGRVVIQLGQRSQLIVSTRVSARNKNGATFRYEIDGSARTRDAIFNMYY